MTHPRDLEFEPTEQTKRFGLDFPISGFMSKEIFETLQQAESYIIKYAYDTYNDNDECYDTFQHYLEECTENVIIFDVDEYERSLTISI